MDPEKLDEITENFTREYYPRRVCWLEGSESAVTIVAISNTAHKDASAAGAAAPAILVEWTPYRPSQPLFAIPRGAPLAVTLPRVYEKVPITYIRR